MYVATIKKISSGDRKLEKPIWEYASYDKYAGSFSTGYPCFTSVFIHAITFETREEAEEEIKEWIKHCYFNWKDYDKNSFAIREITFKTIKHIQV